MIPQLSPIVNMLQKSFTNHTHCTKIIHIAKRLRYANNLPAKA